MELQKYAQMIENVYKGKRHGVEDYKLRDASEKVFMYQNTDHHIIFAIRGMRIHNSQDRQAVLSLIHNDLKNTARYRQDSNFIKRNLEKSPDAKDVLFLGHSLGGAICDQLLDDKIATKCITFNPAIQPKDLKNHGNQRYYNTNDFLYILIGRYASNIHIAHFSILSITNLGLPNLFSFWTSHKLSQFIEGYEPKLPFQLEQQKQEKEQEHTGQSFVQCVVLYKSAFENKMRATEWIVRHKYKHSKVSESPDEYRFQQLDPKIHHTGLFDKKEMKLTENGKEIGYVVVMYS